MILHDYENHTNSNPAFAYITYFSFLRTISRSLQSGNLKRCEHICALGKKLVYPDLDMQNLGVSLLNPIKGGLEHPVTKNKNKPFY